VIPFEYDSAFLFSEGLAMVSKIKGEDDFYGFIDKTGRAVVPIKYDGARGFSEGLAPVVLKGKAGYINKQGRIVIPLKYYQTEPFSNGLAPVQLGDKGRWGFIDKGGKLVIPFKYEYAWKFSDGLAAVVVNDKVGYIERSGRMAIRPKYKVPEVVDGSPGAFSRGLAYVELEGANAFRVILTSA
jgi:WG containing repeat